MQHGGDVVVVSLAHDDIDLPVPFLKTQQAFRNQRRHHRAQRGHGDPPALDPPQSLATLLHGTENAPRIGQKGHALIGECHLAPACKKLHTEKIFEHPHAHRNRGLRDIEPGCGLGEAQVARDPVEGAELIDIHKEFLLIELIFL